MQNEVCEVNKEVLLTFRFKRNLVNCISSRCVSKTSWENLLMNLQTQNLIDKLKISYYEALHGDIVNNISVNDNKEAINAFKFLYGDSFNSDVDLLEILFKMNSLKSIPKIYYDDDDEISLECLSDISPECSPECSDNECYDDSQFQDAEESIPNRDGVTVDSMIKSLKKDVIPNHEGITVESLLTALNNNVITLHDSGSEIDDILDMYNNEE